MKNLKNWKEGIDYLTKMSDELGLGGIVDIDENYIR